ncbi:MAG: AlpA family transcriptional regulator [Cupriavidus sp.]|nr:AlpA family transcriptional regulator [Cupriavidus sp.]
MVSSHAGTSKALDARGIPLHRADAADVAEPERFMRLPEVMAVCGLPSSTVYDCMRRGAFPKPVPLGGKSVAWLSSEIRQWMDSRVAARQR